MIVNIVEALCGCGKSHAMIEKIRKDPSQNYMWVTPFLDEAGDDDSGNVGRVRTQAPELCFQTPSAKHKNKKLGDLARLLSQGENVSITHNLFLNITEEMLTYIKEHNYVIIIDEVIDKVDIHTKVLDRVDDIKGLIDTGIIEVNDKGQLKWVGIVLNAFKDEYELCQKGMLYFYNNRLLIKRYNSRVYELAKEVYVLTYMFQSSPMRVWFDANDIEWQYYYLPLRTTTPERKAAIRSLVHIEPLEKWIEDVNDTSLSSFSSTWFKSKEAERLSQDMIATANKLYRRWYKRHNEAPKIMFTTFKDHIDKVAGKGCKRINYSEAESNFVAKNSRATNNHADKDYLIYWVNVYPHVDIKNYLDSLVDKGNGLDSDKFALSEMIQWVFRSALREEERIYLFVASRRMRELFLEWLDSED